jgi:hypothetical protein
VINTSQRNTIREANKNKNIQAKVRPYTHTTSVSKVVCFGDGYWAFVNFLFWHHKVCFCPFLTGSLHSAYILPQAEAGI